MNHPTPPPTLHIDQPLRYDPAYEVEEEHEAITQAEMLNALHSISATTLRDNRHATRSVHAKSHGLLHGRLQVLAGLPPAYAQGMFAEPAPLGDWPVVLRLSSTPGDLLDDAVSTPRGLALKVIGVPGERLPGSEHDSTQDFVLINGPAFISASAHAFLRTLKLLAPTTDKAPGLKKALSAALQGTEKLLEAVGGGSATLRSLGGHPETHVLGETYFSQAPVLYGPYMAKLALAPVAPALCALTNLQVELDGKPNGLREAVVAYFASHAAEWELRVQLCTDLGTMPLEDASVEWPQQRSPYIAVARITAPPQTAWSAALAALVDDGMQFNPWHGLAAHRPLGAIMRVRQAAYAMSARFRAEHNGRVLIEPQDLSAWPD
ncbi:catalase family protein [Oxalobacteraceae bacterium]|nr:catalase family protein [Oxalobacteraceae bacterium]